MKKRLMTLAALLTAHCGLSAQETRYSCIPLSEELRTSWSARGHAINMSGDIVGEAGYPDAYGVRATLWSGKKPIDLGIPDTPWRSVAEGINDAGVVAGWGTDSNGASHAMVWTNGVATVLPSLTPQYGSSASAINNRGLVVGESSTDTTYGSSHAVLWRNGKIFDLGTLAGWGLGWSSYAYDINDDGIIVGRSDTSHKHIVKAVRWSGNPRTMTDLGSLPGTKSSLASAINRAGTIVGVSQAPGGAPFDTRAVAWHNNELIDLGNLPGYVSSGARDINDHGVIVGQTDDGAGVALVWYGLDQAPVDLNTRLDSKGCTDWHQRSYVLKEASSINNAGMIVARGLTGINQFRVFRLVPIAN